MLMQQIKRYFFILLALIALNLMMGSCIFGKRSSSGMRQAEKMEKQMETESKKEKEAAIKAHNDRQSDQAKQMMKDAKKREKKANKNRKRSLWDRLFRKDCK